MTQTIRDFQTVARNLVWDELNSKVQRRLETGEVQRDRVARAVASGEMDTPERLRIAIGLAERGMSRA